MTDAERLTAVQAFISSLQKMGQTNRPIPYDPGAFAAVVRDLARGGNRLAKQFRVLNTAAGASCPDFLQGMTAAQTAGLISRMNPTYQFFAIQATMPSDQADSMDAENRAFADELAKSYFATVRPGSLAKI